MKESTKEWLFGRIVLIIILGLIAVIAFVIIPNSGWKSFEKSNLYDAFNKYETADIDVNGTPERPYVIIHNDMEKGKGITSWFQDWKVLGCSEGMKTIKNYSNAKTLVICESYFETANYGSTGYSEKVIIYCVNTETGELYTSNQGDYIIDEIEAKPFPYSVSVVPNYRHPDRKIKRYVKKHFDEW